MTYSILMAYLAVASFLFEKVIGITPTQFGTTTLGLSFVYMFGSFLNARLLRHFSMDRLIANGVILMWVSMLLLLLYATILPLTYWGLVLFVAVVYLACGSLFANSSALAFSAIDKNIGSASALYSTMQVLAGAIFTSIISWFHPTTTLPLAVLVGIMCLVMTGLAAWKPVSSTNKL